MTTTVGDVPGKIMLLRRDLFQIRYPSVFDEEAGRAGRSQALLPIISFILSKFSRHVLAVAASYNLSGRKGKRYIENMFKLAREQFGMRVVLSSAQFLAEGYAERKLMFVHQLIVVCREYHSTAVRQERLGLLQQRQRTFSRNQSSPGAAGVVKIQPKQGTNENKAVQFSLQNSSNHKKVPSTPEEPRQLPKSLIATFNQVADDDLAASAGKEEGEEDELEERQSMQTEECSYSPCIHQSNHAENGEIENKQSPVPTSVPPPWWPNDILKLSQDTEDISTRIQTLEQRLEQTNAHMMNLQTSNKAHMMVLEGRLSAVEQKGRQHRLQEIINPSEGKFLPATNAPTIHADNTPEVPLSHPIDFTKISPSKCKSNEEHLHGVEGPKTDSCDAIVDARRDVSGFQGNDCSQRREGQDALCMNIKNMSIDRAPKQDDSFDNAFLLNSSPHMYHTTSNSLNSHDVLLSLRARLNEAQIVLDEARATLHLSP